MGNKIYWVSRHDLSPAQMQAIRDLHGDDAEIVKDPVVFRNHTGLMNYLLNHSDGFVYAVADAPHYLHAALSGYRFGVFENHHARRQNGSFGLAAVYHVVVDRGSVFPFGAPSALVRVWVNHDPASDKGDTLIPVARF